MVQKVYGQSRGILRSRNQRESSLFRLKSAAAAVILADQHLSLLSDADEVGGRFFLTCNLLQRCGERSFEFEAGVDFQGE